MLTSIKIDEIIKENPKILAVVDEKSYAYALRSNIKIVFILNATISNLTFKVNSLLRLNKTVFVHIDMVNGLESSSASVDYIYDLFKGEIGIITTRHSLVKRATLKNLRVIYRAFLVDSTSKKSLISNLNSDIIPDAIEIMPASSIKIIKEIKTLYPKLNIIAGGLITDKSEVEDIFKAGANAISTSCIDIFKID